MFVREEEEEEEEEERERSVGVFLVFSFIPFWFFFFFFSFFFIRRAIPFRCHRGCSSLLLPPHPTPSSYPAVQYIVRRDDTPATIDMTTFLYS